MNHAQSVRIDRNTLDIHNPNQYNALPYGFTDPQAPVCDAPRLTTGGIWLVIHRTYRSGRITGWEQFPTLAKANDYYRFETGNTAPPPNHDPISVYSLRVQPEPKPEPVEKPEPEPRRRFERRYSLPEYDGIEWVVVVRNAKNKLIERVGFMDLGSACDYYRTNAEP